MITYNNTEDLQQRSFLECMETAKSIWEDIMDRIPRYLQNMRSVTSDMTYGRLQEIMDDQKYIMEHIETLNPILQRIEEKKYEPGELFQHALTNHPYVSMFYTIHQDIVTCLKVMGITFSQLFSYYSQL